MTRLYHVIVKNDRTGGETLMTSSPVTHREGCTLMSKFTTKRPWLRKMLKEVQARRDPHPRARSGRARTTTPRALLMAVRLAWRRHGRGGPGDLGGTMNIANAVARARKHGVSEDELERAKAEALGLARRTRRDPGMTARRATVIERAHERNKAARKGFDERRFQRGGGYTPEELREIERRAGTKSPSNRALGALELHRFLTNPPDKLFAYYKDGARVGTPITTWVGGVLGRVIWRGVEQRKFGGKSVAIRMQGANGLTYAGTCNLTGGDYCNLRKVKSKSKSQSQR